MATLKKAKTIENLEKKGFCREDRDHIYLAYVPLDGGRTSIRTKISRCSGNDISAGLVGAMAKQCHLSTKKFCEFAKCNISQGEYEVLLKASGYFSSFEA